MLDLTGIPEINKEDTPYGRALKQMEGHFPPVEIFAEVAASIPQVVPDVEVRSSWKHGSMRCIGRIGGYNSWAIESNMAPSDLDLSRIDYIAFYRQAVSNKHTGEVKFFGTSIPIPFDWNREDLEAMARESFLKLQELVTEFYNREGE